MGELKRTPVPLPAPPAKSRKRGSAPTSALSQEFVDSDNDSSVGNPAPSSPQRKRPGPSAPTHRPSKVARPTSNLASKKHAALVSVPKSASPSTKLQSKPSPLEDSSGASSASDNDLDSDSSSDAPAASPPRRASKLPTESHTVAFRPTPNYVPPRGFHAVPVNNETVSRPATMFDSVQAKQVWHITAPADVSLKDLSSLAVDRAVQGELVMTYKDTNYGFFSVPRSSTGAHEVLIPRKNGYMALAAPFSHTFHLRATVQVPSFGSNQDTAIPPSETRPSITRSTIRAPRPQVKGLKMRFLPTGFDGDAVEMIGGSDSETEALEEAAGPAEGKGLGLAAGDVKKDGTRGEAKAAKARRPNKEKKRGQRD